MTAKIKCDQNGCTEHATHTLVWIDRKNYCEEHTAKFLGVADAMGFPTPANTVMLLIDVFDTDFDDDEEAPYDEHGYDEIPF